MSNIIINKKNGIEYIQFKSLLKYDNIVHAFIMKAGNMDARNNKEFTYSKAAEEFNIPKEKFVILEQKHTDNVQNVDNGGEILHNCDGSITDKENIALTCITADCIPIIMYDKNKKVIANVHSGWKGTVQKISAKTIDKMMDIYGSNPKDIICCMGPSIRKVSF